MFLWGIDYLHFQSDKSECVGVCDVTCPKPSRDYKAEDRVDLGPCSAPPRRAPFSHGDAQGITLPMSKSHHVLHWVDSSIAQNVQQGFGGSGQNTKRGELLLSHPCEPWGASQSSAHGEML